MKLKLLMRSTLALFCLFIQLAHGQPVFVYPGDAGNDSLVSVRDLLPIGIGFGLSQPPREAPTTDWLPQLAEASPTAVLPVSGVPLVHLDADGDGLITDLDIDAIARNYDSTAVARPLLPPAYLPEKIAERRYCPRLRLVFDRDTAAVGDTFYLQLWLDILPEMELTEEEAMLGLSFSLRYDPTYVRDSHTVVLPNREREDLMYVAAAFQQAQAFRALPSGQVDFGAAGRGKNFLMRPDRLGEVRFIVEDMLIRSRLTLPFSVDLDEASLLILNRFEEVIRACPTVTDTIFLTDGLLDHDRSPLAHEPELRLFPNPASSSIHLQSSVPIHILSLYDSAGRLVWEHQPSPASRRLSLSLPDLAAGMYYLGVSTPQGRLWRRLIMQ